MPEESWSAQRKAEGRGGGQPAHLLVGFGEQGSANLGCFSRVPLHPGLSLSCASALPPYRGGGCPCSIRLVGLGASDRQRLLKNPQGSPECEEDVEHRLRACATIAWSLHRPWLLAC